MIETKIIFTKKGQKFLGQLEKEQKTNFEVKRIQIPKINENKNTVQTKNIQTNENENFVENNVNSKKAFVYSHSNSPRNSSPKEIRSFIQGNNDYPKYIVNRINKIQAKIQQTAFIINYKTDNILRTRSSSPRNQQFQVNDNNNNNLSNQSLEENPKTPQCDEQIDQINLSYIDNQKQKKLLNKNSYLGSYRFPKHFNLQRQFTSKSPLKRLQELKEIPIQITETIQKSNTFNQLLNFKSKTEKLSEKFNLNQQMQQNVSNSVQNVVQAKIDYLNQKILFMPLDKEQYIEQRKIYQNFKIDQDQAQVRKHDTLEAYKTKKFGMFDSSGKQIRIISPSKIKKIK